MNVAFLIIWTVVGWLVGFYICKGYKKKVEILQEMGEICEEIGQNIHYFKRPTADVLASYPFKTELSDILLVENYKSQYIDVETTKNFKDLLKEMETCETVTVKSKLQAFSEKNKKTLAEATKQYSQKGETSKKLGMLFGLLIGILWL